MVAERMELSSSSGVVAVDIPKGQWHNVKVLEPTVLLEIKEGPYRPISDNEILK